MKLDSDFFLTASLNNFIDSQIYFEASIIQLFDLCCSNSLGNFLDYFPLYCRNSKSPAAESDRPCKISPAFLQQPPAWSPASALAGFHACPQQSMRHRAAKVILEHFLVGVASSLLWEYASGFLSFYSLFSALQYHWFSCCSSSV